MGRAAMELDVAVEVDEHTPTCTLAAIGAWGTSAAGFCDLRRRVCGAPRTTRWGGLPWAEGKALHLKAYQLEAP